MRTRYIFRLVISVFIAVLSSQLPAQETDVETKAQMAQRDRLVKQAIDAANAGNLDEATVLLERVYSLEQTIFGEAHDELIQTLEFLSRVAARNQNDATIIGYRERQLAITKKLHGDDDYRTQDAIRAVADAKQRVTFTEVQKKQVAQAEILHLQLRHAFQVGNYAESVQLAKDCLVIQKQVLGDQHPDYASSLSVLAGLYFALGDYPRAEPLFRESLAITEKVMGKMHPDYAIGLSNLASLYHSRGDSLWAEPLYREACAIWEETLGKQHPNYANGLNNLAILYTSMGDYPRAEPLYLEALEIQEKLLGKEHRSYAFSLSSLAGLYHSLGDYRRAESLYHEAIAIQEKVLGKEHPDYADSLHNLAVMYEVMGDYARAEPLCREVIAIREKVLGKEHPDYAVSLNNLAVLYRAMGDYLRAEPLYRDAMAIQERVLGKENSDYSGSLSNLAGLYHLMGDYLRAELLYLEAISIDGKVLGKQHPHYAGSLNNLAGLYRSMGDVARAEPLYREAMAIQERVLGKQHISFATSLSNLARLYHSIGDLPQAEALYREAFEIFGQVLGKETTHYAASLQRLAEFYFLTGDDAQAEPLFREAVEITLRNLELTADVQSQRQQVAMGESLRHQLDGYLALAAREPKFQEAAYAALLRWKGSVWQRQRRLRLLIDQPALKPRFAALSAVSSKLSALILSPPDPQQLDAWHRQLDELTNQREQLERDLSLASAEFRQTTISVTPERLRACLPQGTMLVDFLEYTHFTPANMEQQTKKSSERRLLVHLVRQDHDVKAIDLGAAEPLNELVQTWRRDLGQSLAAVEAAQELRQRIWEPLAESLIDITTVYVSPDGLLGQFPLGALPGQDPGTYLLEELAIIMLPVPQGLPTLAATAPQPDSATIDRFCLVGGVDYEKVASPEETPQPETPTNPAAAPINAATTMLAVRGNEHQQYGALPGTIREIETIESLIRQYRPESHATILRGSSASEAAFVRLAPGHRYLHVATHGFFAPESVKNALIASADSMRMLGSGDSRPSAIIGSHPDLLSGLVFAGANQSTHAGADDGILTAAEVQSLDLRGVELAILSACETGLGKSAGGEGIIGLQRAFQLSGAKTTITSLWQVDDAATQALMVEFYRNLFERKLSKLESLRQAQIWMLNHPDAIEGKDLSTRGDERKVKPLDPDVSAQTSTRSLPAYWAAFQLSGDPR